MGTRLKNGVRKKSGARRVVVRFMVRARHTYRRRDIVLFIPERFERLGFSTAGLSIRLEKSIRCFVRLAVVFAGRVSAAGTDIGIDRGCAWIVVERKRSARGALELVGVGSLVAGFVLSGTSGERSGLDVDPVMVTGCAGVGAQFPENIQRRTRRGVGRGWLEYFDIGFLVVGFFGVEPNGIAFYSATLRAWLLFGSLFLLLMSILLVAVGWSIRSARLGAVWGLVVMLGIYSLGMMFAAGGLRVNRGVELWNAGASPAEADLLLTTVNQTSDWSKTNANALSVTIVGIDSPALRWLLHQHKVEVVSVLDASTSPSIVITTGQDNPSLAAGYRGQSFVWRQSPLWDAAQTGDWLHWVAFHQMAQNSETIIVWVRNDLFIDANSSKP